MSCLSFAFFFCFLWPNVSSLSTQDAGANPFLTDRYDNGNIHCVSRKQTTQNEYRAVRIHYVLGEHYAVKNNPEPILFSFLWIDLLQHTLFKILAYCSQHLGLLFKIFVCFCIHIIYTKKPDWFLFSHSLTLYTYSLLQGNMEHQAMHHMQNLQWTRFITPPPCICVWRRTHKSHLGGV